MSKRSSTLALRLEKGALALEAYANALSEADWQTRVPHDGRKIGVVVHHVATMYPLEIDLARTLAAGQPIEGVTDDSTHREWADLSWSVPRFRHLPARAGSTRDDAVQESGADRVRPRDQ